MEQVSTKQMALTTALLAAVTACSVLCPEAAARESCRRPPVALPAVLMRPCSESIEAVIGRAPRQHLVRQHLRIRVRSLTDDWGLQLSCTDLRADGETIDAVDVDVISHGPIRSLDKPRTVIDSMPKGRNLVTVKLAIHPEAPLECGVYEGKLTLQPMVQSGPRPPALDLPFRVTVESDLAHELLGHEFAFAVDGSDLDLVDSVRGRIRADMPVTLTLSAQEGRVDRVPCVQGDCVPADGDAPPIPVEWALAIAGESEREACTSAAQYRTWRLDSAPSGIDYALICRPRPAICQPAGTYRQNLVITVCPSP